MQKIEFEKEKTRHLHDLRDTQIQCESEKITFKSQNEISVDILKEENQILQKSKGELLLKIFELENNQKDI